MRTSESNDRFGLYGRRGRGPYNDSLNFLRAKGGPYQVPRLYLTFQVGRQMIVEGLKTRRPAGTLVNRVRPLKIEGEIQCAISIDATQVTAWRRDVILPE